MPSSINTVYFVDGIFVDYVGNPLPLGIAGGIGTEGPTGPTGPTGNSSGLTGSTSLSLYQARKYVKEFWPNGNSTLVITRAEILAATQAQPPSDGIELPYGPYFGPNPPGPTDSGFSFADVSVSLWKYLVGTTGWVSIPVEQSQIYGPPGGVTNTVSIDDSTGDIYIDYKYPSGNQTRIRAVIII